MKTFGEVVAEAWMSRGLTQKALAARLKKKDGASIGLAHISDIEHNRRNPPAPHFVAQLAHVLSVPHDVLRFYVRRLYEEVLSRQDDPSRERIVPAYTAFRRELGENHDDDLGRIHSPTTQGAGLGGREVAAAVRKNDGTPISIPYLVDLAL